MMYKTFFICQNQKQVDILLNYYKRISTNINVFHYEQYYNIAFNILATKDDVFNIVSNDTKKFILNDLDDFAEEVVYIDDNNILKYSSDLEIE